MRQDIMASSVDPVIVLNELCAKATSRTSQSLKALHEVLEKHSKSQSLDFSIATIGRLSKEHGGPSTQTIRNCTGKHFKQLIEVWAAYSGTTTTKLLSVRQKQLLNNNDQHILDSIEDPVIRAVIGSLIAERNKYRDQLNVLKANADIVIDRRKAEFVASNTLPSLSPLEVEAFRTAISDDFMTEMKWVVMPTGQVKSIDGVEIYKRGYVNGLLKLLAGK